jgi:hypothetical protein
MVINCFLDRDRECTNFCMAYDVGGSPGPCRLLNGIYSIEQLTKVMMRKERAVVATPPPKVIP